MSAATERRVDASPEAVPEASASATPFTMLTGDPNAMVCEDDVCFLPPTAH